MYVLCESYKFSEKSQIDGLIINKGTATVIEDQSHSFNHIALTFDLTPQKLISLVITETGVVPPSSVSVVLREFSIYDSAYISYNPK
jgi:translation initiation factor eIF-2B subunit delta